MTACPDLPLPPLQQHKLPLPYVLLAAALHLLLLSILPQQQKAPLTVPHTLQVDMRAFIQRPVVLPEIVSMSATSAPTFNRTHPISSEVQPESSSTNIPATTSGSQLSDAARQQIRLEARQQSAYRQAQQHAFLTSPGDEPISVSGHAHPRRQAGEKHLTNGIVQITNADGSVYCLQATSDLRQRDTPIPLLAVPSTCP